MRISYSLNDLLAKANGQMTSFKDEYMSVEHVIMALFEINENLGQRFIEPRRYE